MNHAVFICRLALRNPWMAAKWAYLFSRCEFFKRSFRARLSAARDICLQLDKDFMTAEAIGLRTALLAATMDLERSLDAMLQIGTAAQMNYRIGRAIGLIAEVHALSISLADAIAAEETQNG